jgi:hypothetical protein
MKFVRHFDLECENYEIGPLALFRFSILPAAIYGCNPETVCNLLKTRVLARISARNFCEFATLASCKNTASIRASIVERLPQPLFAGCGL